MKNTFTLTDGEKLTVTCSDGHIVTLYKISEERLSLKVERLERGSPVWRWVKGWFWWLLCVYLSVVMTLLLAEAMGHISVTGALQEPALKRVLTKIAGVWEQPVLKKVLANLSQTFKK
jgi:fucose 4-O-acetylase-like acetyltransferase